MRARLRGKCMVPMVRAPLLTLKLLTLLLVFLVLNGSVAIGALLGRAGYSLCGLGCEGVLPKLDS